MMGKFIFTSAGGLPTVRASHIPLGTEALVWLLVPFSPLCYSPQQHRQARSNGCLPMAKHGNALRCSQGGTSTEPMRYQEQDTRWASALTGSGLAGISTLWIVELWRGRIGLCDVKWSQRRDVDGCLFQRGSQSQAIER